MSLARLYSTLHGHELVRTALSSALVVLAGLMGTAATFGYTLLMARTMAVADVGIVWTIWSAAFILAAFVTLNVGGGAVKDLVHARTRGEDAVAAGFVRVSREVLLAASAPMIAVALVIFWLANPKIFAEHTALVVLAALGAVVMGWTITNGAIAAALYKGVQSQVMRTLMRPLIVLAVFVVVALADARPGVGFAIGTLLCAVAVSALIQFAVLRPTFAAFMHVRPETERRWHWIGTGLVLMPSRLLSDNLKNVFVLAASIGLAATETALFTIALSLISFFNLGIAAVDIVFNPRISAAIARDQRRRRDNLLSAAGLLKVLPVAAVAVIVVGFAPQILSIFGEAYSAGAPLVAWLVLIPLSRTLFGSATLILQNEGRRREIALVSIFGVGAVLIAIPVGASVAGVEGAAIAGSLAYVAMQAANWLVCVIVTRIDPSPLARVTGRRLARPGADVEAPALQR